MLRSKRVILRFTRISSLIGLVVALCLVVITPVQATHPRPKGAFLMRLSLVPAYNQCSDPNRTHGPPLAFPSCNSPTQASGQATTGTPDAFGGAANSTNNHLFLRVWAGQPGPPEESNVELDSEISDVRCVPTGVSCGAANATGPPDYVGELRYELTIRRTDHWNGPPPGGGVDPATVEDYSLGFGGAVCGQTASTSTGSTCNVHTFLGQSLSGPDGKRAVWELMDVRVYDGGADGDGDTTADNTLYLRQGVFVP